MNAPDEPNATVMNRLREDMVSERQQTLSDDLLGYTMFDQPGSEDGSITALVRSDRIEIAPAQSLVRIESNDKRSYLGVVGAGPYAIPDSLRYDSAVLIAVSTHGADYSPPYHGRIQITLLGERLADGTLIPARWRPRPQSAVYRLSAQESAQALKADGDLRLGTAIGLDELTVNIPSKEKSVLPRHLAVLGTTGGGKSNSIARLIQQAQSAGMSVILLDVEGEYTALNESTNDARMLAALENRGISPQGIPAEKMDVYHLIGRECANPKHPNRREFSLQFAQLSPYAINEILDLSEPQQERFLKAYDIAKENLRDLGIFPRKGHPEDDRLAMEIDEFERGYPRMTLPILIDVIDACLNRADGSGNRKKKDDEEDDSYSIQPRSKELHCKEGIDSLRKRIHASRPPGNAISWRALKGKFSRLNRLRVFYDEATGIKPIIYKQLLRPGQVSVIDLSDSGLSELNNLVIADLLRGVQSAQDEIYDERTRKGESVTPTLIIIEEAHEFLAEERIAKMRILFEQVARIAKRGRKRWIGLTFVTQLPGHLPRQVLGLCNSFILHKLTDPTVISSLKKSLGNVDEGLWTRLPSLAPGQAVVSFPHLTRPLLTAIDPSPCKLRMVD